MSWTDRAGRFANRLWQDPIIIAAILVNPHISIILNNGLFSPEFATASVLTIIFSGLQFYSFGTSFPPNLFVINFLAGLFYFNSLFEDNVGCLQAWMLWKTIESWDRWLKKKSEGTWWRPAVFWVWWVALFGVVLVSSWVGWWLYVYGLLGWVLGAAYSPLVVYGAEGWPGWGIGGLGGFGSGGLSGVLTRTVTIYRTAEPTAMRPRKTDPVKMGAWWFP